LYALKAHAYAVTPQTYEHVGNPRLLRYGLKTAARGSDTAALQDTLLAYSLLHALKERLEVALPPEVRHKLVKHLVGCLEEQNLHGSLHTKVVEKSEYGTQKM
jgi:hypothetical protein